MTRKKKQDKNITPRSIIPIKDTDIEVIIQQKPTKDLIAFDFGLLFTEGTNEIQVYVDDTLREALDGLLTIHKQVILKVNVFSPGVVMIVPSE